MKVSDGVKSGSANRGACLSQCAAMWSWCRSNVGYRNAVFLMGVGLGLPVDGRGGSSLWEREKGFNDLQEAFWRKGLS